MVIKCSEILRRIRYNMTMLAAELNNTGVSLIM